MLPATADAILSGVTYRSRKVRRSMYCCHWRETGAYPQRLFFGTRSVVDLIPDMSSVTCEKMIERTSGGSVSIGEAMAEVLRDANVDGRVCNGREDCLRG